MNNYTILFFKVIAIGISINDRYAFDDKLMLMDNFVFIFYVCFS